ncbi:MAG: hypothetical protein QNJ53_06345 [Pleurocapsa sp. MO_192.B19]|nr:hypothetical protein [Pleurocapsa sp. MO_192.B19]
MKISELTGRDIFDAIQNIVWWSRLDDVQFPSHVYNIELSHTVSISL